MGRSPCCDKVGLKKGTWTAEEDQKLLTYIEQHGHGSWRALPAKAGLQRCGKSCRLRWTNYLRPDIKRGKFSLQEEQTVIQLHALLGNRWSAIATHLPKRTDNEIKNYWNTHLKKRLAKMGIDPTTHKPKTNSTLSSTQQKHTANLSHMAQWESARLEAEARLVRESKPTPMIITNPFRTRPAFLPPCLDILKVWQGTWTTAKHGTNNLSPTSNGTLLSPTSTLNFSDNMFVHPSTTTVSFSTNLPTSFPATNYFGNSESLQVGVVTKDSNPNARNHDPTLKDIMKANVLHELDNFEYPIAAAASVSTEELLRHPSFMEAIAGVLSPDHADEDGRINAGAPPAAYHIAGIEVSCNGNLEDYGKYWNNVILDDSASFPYGSPVF